MVLKARTEPGPARPLAQQRAAAEITTPMPGQKTCRLGGASLDAGQGRLSFVERQADHLQPVVALVELQDLALADHVVVVGDDPELDLNTHVRPTAVTVEATTYPPVTPQTTATSHTLPWSWGKGAIPVDARLQGVRFSRALLPGLRRGPQLSATGQLHQPERLARSSAGHPRAARGRTAGLDLRRLIQLLMVISLPDAQLAPKADRTSQWFPSARHSQSANAQ